MSEYDDQIDAICDRFEEAWLSDKRPSIQDFIGQSDSKLRFALLENLVPLDVDYRMKQGEAIETGDYADLGPEAIAIALKELQRNLDRTAESKLEGVSDEVKQATPVDLPGSQIGPYKLIEKIGEGGMGSVWLAQQTHPVRRSVALKLSRSFPIPRNLSQSQRAEFQKRLDELANRFESERQTQAVMDHPNIAKVLDAGTTDDKRPYFVMELVEGAPINEYCDRVRATIRQRIDLMIQACKAIQHAHQKGIIHRDIKPSNVLVTTQDNQAVVKVIDFGLAKVTSEADKLLGAATPTQTGVIMGTYLYMSPEQAGINTKDIDTRSDVYSLGVLLFELLTGSTPIDRARANELIDLQLLAAIREEEPPRPSDRLSKLQDSGLSISSNRQTDVRKLSSILRGELDWIALKALAKDRKRRYDGPTQLAEDLQRYLDGEAIVARPPSVRYKLGKALRKYRIAVGIITLTLALIATGFAATYSQLQRALIAERQSDQNAQLEKAQRILAETNLSRAEKAEASTQERVKELQELTDFQSNQFLTMDVAVMGSNLKRLLEENFAQSERGASQEQSIAFDDLLTNLNLVDISRSFLERNIIRPAIKAADEKYASQPIFQASIYNAIRTAAHKMGIPNLPLELARSSFELRKRSLGDKHEDTQWSAVNLADMLQDQGKASEAELIYREALAWHQGSVGNDHTHKIRALIGLARCLHGQGKSEEAEPLYRESIDGARKHLGNDHSDTLSFINNFAVFLRQQRRLSEAEPLYREVLERTRNLLGAGHPDTLQVMNNTAVFLDQQGKFNEAELLHREVLEGRRNLLGNEHPDTLISINNMALSLADQGKYSEAEPLLREALISCRKQLGSDNPDTLQSINNLAAFLRSQGKFAEATPLLKEALGGRRKLFGNDHPATLACINNLAQLLCAQGEVSEAEPLLREALDCGRKFFGNDHALTLVAIQNMAGFHISRNQLDEAEVLLREALEGNRNRVGNEDPETLIAMSNLAVVLVEKGKTGDAEPLLREALEGTRKRRGNDHLDTLQSMANTATFLHKQGKFNEAEHLYREAMTGFRKKLGIDNPLTLQIVNYFAFHLESQSKYTEAEQLYREGLASYRRLYGTDHPNTLTILNSLGECVFQQDNLVEAESIYRELLSLAEGRPDEAWRIISRIRLSAVLLRAKKYRDEAKQLIESAYNDLRSSPESVPEEKRETIFDDASKVMKLLETATTDVDQPSSSVPTPVDK